MWKSGLRPHQLCMLHARQATRLNMCGKLWGRFLPIAASLLRRKNKEQQRGVVHLTVRMCRARRPVRQNTHNNNNDDTHTHRTYKPSSMVGRPPSPSIPHGKVCRVVPGMSWSGVLHNIRRATAGLHIVNTQTTVYAQLSLSAKKNRGRQKHVH